MVSIKQQIEDAIHLSILNHRNSASYIKSKRKKLLKEENFLIDLSSILENWIKDGYGVIKNVSCNRFCPSPHLHISFEVNKSKTEKVYPPPNHAGWVSDKCLIDLKNEINLLYEKYPKIIEYRKVWYAIDDTFKIWMN